MSNFTDFFPVSTGGGDSAIVTDPNKLPKIILIGNIDSLRYDNDGISTSSNSFTSAMYVYGAAVGNVLNNDTYNTIANITGSGYLLWCLSSTNATAENTVVTIKITVDGNVSEISGIINQRAAGDRDRLLIGAYTAGVGDSTSGSSSSYNSGGDFGASSTYSRFPSSGIQTQPKCGIIRPDAFNFPGMPKLRFETDLKVEMKISTYEANGTSRTAAVSYRLD